jgi:hypothetical protein
MGSVIQFPENVARERRLQIALEKISVGREQTLKAIRALRALPCGGTENATLKNSKRFARGVEVSKT